MTEKNYHRYSKEERIELIDKMLEKKYRDKSTWDEVADAFGVARSTIRRWRLGDEWRMVEARWRRVMREEARSDTTMLAQDALGVLQDLMHTARGDFTRYSAAAKILDLVGVGDEIEEAKVDQTNELMKFIEKMQGRAVEDAKLKAIGIDPDSIIEAEVRPGGLLPEAIVTQNKLVMDEQLLSQERLEQEVFGAVEETDESDPETF